MARYNAPLPIKVTPGPQAYRLREVDGGRYVQCSGSHSSSSSCVLRHCRRAMLQLSLQSHKWHDGGCCAGHGQLQLCRQNVWKHADERYSFQRNGFWYHDTSWIWRHYIRRQCRHRYIQSKFSSGCKTCQRPDDQWDGHAGFQDNYKRKINFDQPEHLDLFGDTRANKSKLRIVENSGDCWSYGKPVCKLSYLRRFLLGQRLQQHDGSVGWWVERQFYRSLCHLIHGESCRKWCNGEPWLQRQLLGQLSHLGRHNAMMAQWDQTREF